MAIPEPHNGKTILFWQDQWDGQDLQSRWPELFSYCTNKNISLHSILTSQLLTQHFHMPVSEIAFLQFQQISDQLQNWVQIDEQDKWNYRWGNNFSSSKAYKTLMGHNQIHNIYKWLWKGLCQPKHKIFFWLLISDRLSTRNILRRKQMHLPSYNCVLCLNGHEETRSHLFLQCSFAKECWQLIHIDIPSDSDFPEIAELLREQIQSRFFIAAIILMCWAIWTSRNKLIFEGIQPSPVLAKETFQKELLLLKHRVKASLSLQLDQWIQTFL
jgi:hypothetical protein